MTCIPQALVDAAICYTKMSKEESDAAAIFLLCSWANSESPEPPSGCGTPSNAILISGAGSGQANGTYIKNPNPLLPNLWNSITDPQAYIRLFGGFALLEYGLAANQLYKTPIADFPCTWETDLDGVNPPPTGQYVSPPISWTPNTEVVNWVDINGAQSGDLAAFLANANFSTVSSMIFNATGNLTSISILQALPALSNLDLNTNSLTSLDVHDMASITSLGVGNNPGLTTLNIAGCASISTLFCNGCDITGTLNVTPCAGSLTLLNCSSNANLTTLTLTGCTALTTLDCNACALTGLDPTTCTALDSLHCQDNPFGTNHTLDLSACTVLNDMWGYNCPGIQVVDMTNIGSMTGYIQFQNCVGLTTLTTPNVSNVDQDIRVTGDTNLGALSFPVLAHVGGELDFDGSGVVTVSVPVLLDSGAVSSGKIDGHNCTSLTTFTCTALQQVISGITDFHGCTSLTSLTFDNLSLSQDIDVHGCTSLTSLSFGNAGGTNIAGALSSAGCTSLASVVTTGIAAYGTAPNPTSDFTNCAISPSANINSILADYVLCLPPTGVPFSIDLSGGTSAAPSVQGVLDKATINATAGCSCVTN